MDKCLQITKPAFFQIEVHLGRSVRTFPVVKVKVKNKKQNKTNNLTFVQDKTA